MLLSLFPLGIFALPFISASQLTTARLSKVYNVMNAISYQPYVPPLDDWECLFTNRVSLTPSSWENGTKAQAILEYNYSSLSVFSADKLLPLPNPFPTSQIPGIVSIAQTTLQNRPKTNTSAAAQGGSPLLTDASAGDPASLGIAILLANASTGNAQVDGVGYGDAAAAELDYLLYDVPRVR